MDIEQIDIPVGWGKISVQVFGNSKASDHLPIIAMHGYLDNSNSFKPVAPFLVKDKSPYYLIAVDLPGMGFSSKIPDGLPYTLKFYLMAIRRVVLYFKLENFFLLAHSFGGSLAMSYAACYQENVLGIVLYDFAVRNCDFDKKETISNCWREELDVYLEGEAKLEEKAKSRVPKEITYEHALKRLLDSNEHINEQAARILLERGLIRINNNYEYTRDIKLVVATTIRDFHAEYYGRSLFENLKCPITQVYATPPPYGEYTYTKMMDMLAFIKEKSIATVNLVPLEGTHHFHMLKPSEAAEIALRQFDEIRQGLKVEDVI